MGNTNSKQLDSWSVPTILCVRMWGVAGWGHPCVLPSLAASSGRTAVERGGALPSSGFQGQKKASQPPSLSEIAISLNCGQNSARKFQTGVSNSGPQIPKHARQNIRGA